MNARCRGVFAVEKVLNPYHSPNIQTEHPTPEKSVGGHTCALSVSVVLAIEYLQNLAQTRS